MLLSEWKSKRLLFLFDTLFPQKGSFLQSIIELSLQVIFQVSSILITVALMTLHNAVLEQLVVVVLIFKLLVAHAMLRFLQAAEMLGTRIPQNVVFDDGALITIELNHVNAFLEGQSARRLSVITESSSFQRTLLHETCRLL